MTGVGIQAKFSKDDRQWDGLAPFNDSLIKDPMQTLVIVATAEVSRIVRDPHEGTEQSTIKVKRIELCLTGEDQLAVTGIIERLYSARTGRNDGGVQRSLFEDQEADDFMPDDAETVAHVPDWAASGVTPVDLEDRQDQPDGAEAWPGDVEFQAAPPNVEDDSASSVQQVKPKRRSRRATEPTEPTEEG